MGMFTQRPEDPTEWAGLPSEPLGPASAVERLDDALPVGLGLGLDAGTSVESVGIPVTPPPAADADDHDAADDAGPDAG